MAGVAGSAIGTTSGVVHPVQDVVRDVEIASEVWVPESPFRMIWTDAFVRDDADVLYGAERVLVLEGEIVFTEHPLQFVSTVLVCEFRIGEVDLATDVDE